MSRSLYKFRTDISKIEHIEAIISQTLIKHNYRYETATNVYRKGNRRIQYYANFEEGTLNICAWKHIREKHGFVWREYNAGIREKRGAVYNTGIIRAVADIAATVNQYYPLQILELCSTVSNTYAYEYVREYDRKKEEYLRRCPHCGTWLEKGQTYCDVCGKPMSEYPPNYIAVNEYDSAQFIPDPGVTEPMSMTSFILGIFSVLSMGILMISGIVTIIFSVLGIEKCKTHPKTKGKGLAVAGLVMGIISCIMSVLVLINLFNSTSHKDGTENAAVNIESTSVPDESSPESTPDAPKVKTYEKGEVFDNAYRSDFVGLRVVLPETWTMKTYDELKEQYEESYRTIEFMAEKDDGGICRLCIYDLDSEYQTIEQCVDFVKQSIINSALDGDVESEDASVDFCGKKYYKIVFNLDSSGIMKSEQYMRIESGKFIDLEFMYFKSAPESLDSLRAAITEYKEPQDYDERQKERVSNVKALPKIYVLYDTTQGIDVPYQKFSNSIEIRGLNSFEPQNEEEKNLALMEMTQQEFSDYVNKIDNMGFVTFFYHRLHRKQQEFETDYYVDDIISIQDFKQY